MPTLSPQPPARQTQPADAPAAKDRAREADRKSFVGSNGSTTASFRNGVAGSAVAERVSHASSTGYGHNGTAHNGTTHNGTAHHGNGHNGVAKTPSGYVVTTPSRPAVAPANGNGTTTLLAKKVKGLIEQRIDLRRRVSEFSNDLLKARELDLANVRIVVTNTMIGLREAMTGMNPDDRTMVLRQVFDGLSDGLAALAGAQAHHELCTAERVGELTFRLRGVEPSFLETCLCASETFADPVRREIKALVVHARESGTRIGPAARSAIELLDERIAQAGRRSVGKRAAAAIIQDIESADNGSRKRKVAKSR